MSEKKIIFIVDDNSVNLLAAKQALTDGGYRALTLKSAESMFELFVKIMPDLILLDIEMPEMDGFTALKKLKENERTANIPVVFLSASVNAETEAKGTELGAVGFLLKPFSPSALLSNITGQLQP